MPSEEKEKPRKKIVVVEEEKPEEVKVEEAVPSTEKVEEESPVEEVKLQTPPPHNPPPVKTKEPHQFNVLFFFLILFFIVLITVLAGGLYVYFNGMNGKQNQPTSTPSMTQEPSATSAPVATSPSPTTAAALSYKISILNGSGKAGEAGRAKALVEKAGLQVESTGNAGSFNFTDTQIQVKSSVAAEVVAKLKDTLGESYSVVVGKALDTKSQFDIIITVGSKAS